MPSSKSAFKIWIEEVRVPFFTATIVPVVLGSIIAWGVTGEFYWEYFFLTLIGALCMHAGTNVANDYYDHVSGTDDNNFEFVRPYTGGSRMIQRGLLTPKQVITGAAVFFLIGSSIGVYLAFERGVEVLYIGLIGLFSGFFYTAPPFRLVATGLGEVFVGLNFGVLMTLGAYFVQAQQLAWEPVVASLPVAFLIAGVLYINEFQDYKADMDAKKNNMIVRLGRQRAVKGYEIIIYATYISILVGVVFQWIPPLTLLAMLTLPMALKAIRIARAYYDDYLKLAPANAKTVMLHMLTGILLTIAYIFQILIF